MLLKVILRVHFAPESEYIDSVFATQLACDGKPSINYSLILTPTEAILFRIFMCVGKVSFTF